MNGMWNLGTYQEGSNDSVVSGFTLLPFTIPNICFLSRLETTIFLIFLTCIYHDAFVRKIYFTLHGK